MTSLTSSGFTNTSVSTTALAGLYHGTPTSSLVTGTLIIFGAVNQHSYTFPSGRWSGMHVGFTTSGDYGETNAFNRVTAITGLARNGRVQTVIAQRVS